MQENILGYKSMHELSIVLLLLRNISINIELFIGHPPNLYKLTRFMRQPEYINKPNMNHYRDFFIASLDT